MYHRSEWIEQGYPRIQIITVGELLKGKWTRIPPRYNPYQQAQFEQKPVQQTGLFRQEA